MTKFSLTAATIFALFSQNIQAESLWLNIAGTIDNRNMLRVVDVKKGEFRLTPVQKNPAIMDQRGWEVVALNSNGEEIYHTFVKDSRYQRFESFSPDTGTIEQIKELFLAENSIDLTLPYDNSLARLKISPVGMDRHEVEKRQELILTRNNIETLISQPTVLPLFNDIYSEKISAAKKSIKRPMVVAIIGDGYTVGEMNNWKTDAQTVSRGFLSDPLINNLKDHFEFVRVDLPSKESGITITNQIKKNTALQTELGCYNTDRLLCVNTNLANSAANQALGYGNYDQILVVANTTHYGGAGYTGIGTLTMNSASTELALHEFGHSAFGLADEYDYGDCRIGSEPNSPNVTQQTDRNKIKWKHLINANTPVPTYHQQEGVIGLFEGADYCTSSKYRPVFDSKMRTLGTQWFGVNEEHIRKVMNEFSSSGANELPVAETGSDFTVTSTTEASRAYELDASASQNAVSYKWSILKGAGTFWLQEKHAGPWVREVNSVKARALIPANTTGEVTYLLTVTGKDNKTASSEITITVEKSEQVNNDQKFLDNLNLHMASQDKDDSVHFTGKLDTNTQPTSKPSYVWRLPVGASGTNGGNAEQSFSIIKTDQIQTLTVSVQAAAGKVSRTLQHTIIIPAKQGSNIPDWDVSKTYDKSCVKVRHNGKVWLNGWWTRGENPNNSGQWGVWRVEGDKNMHGGCVSRSGDSDQ